mgnify:CR=1 FL=1|tara:strand:+ start:363 stop:650 length:288 start_codon:yes stop_codon:yes gene_type:complete
MGELKCFTDVDLLLKENAKDDDVIHIYCYVNSDSSLMNIEFTFVVDPVVPISKKQLSFIQKTCTEKSHVKKLRKDLSEKEQELILKCKYINPENY